jgi:hypothetical protein
MCALEKKNNALRLPLYAKLSSENRYKLERNLFDIIDTIEVPTLYDTVEKITLFITFPAIEPEKLKESFQKWRNPPDQTIGKNVPVFTFQLGHSMLVTAVW